MKSEMRPYLFRTIGMILVCWFVSSCFIPVSYPPRHTLPSEYVFVVLVGASAALLSRPKVPRRFAVYYAFFAALPEILRVISVYRANLRLQSMAGNDPSPIVILFPLGRILLLLVATAVVSGYAGAYLKSKGTCEQSPEGGRANAPLE